MLHVRRSSLRTPLHIQGWWSVVPRVAKKAFLHSESPPRMRAGSIWVKHSSFWRSLSAHCASSELQHLVTIVFKRSLINERKFVLAASLCGNVGRIHTAHSSSLTSSDLCFNDNSTLSLILNLSWVYCDSPLDFRRRPGFHLGGHSIFQSPMFPDLYCTSSTYVCSQDPIFQCHSRTFWT